MTDNFLHPLSFSDKIQAFLRFYHTKIQKGFIVLFNSYIFIFAFLPVMLVGFYVLKKLEYFRASKIFLVFGSLFFYGYWKLSYLPILLLSMGLNYFFALKINHSLWGGGIGRDG